MSATKDLRLLQSYELLDYTPQMVQESKDLNGGKIILKGIIQKADTLNQNCRVYPRAILEREIRNYQKFILEDRALGECVPPGTEIYTNHGWKKIEDISEQEIIATFNPNSEELQFQRINHKVVLNYQGKLYRFKNHQSIDMMVTPNHNLVMWDRNDKFEKVSAENLYQSLIKKQGKNYSHHGMRRAGAKWFGEHPTHVFIAGQKIESELWAAFLGIYLAEGSSSGTKKEIYKKNQSVSITQNPGLRADRIKILLNKLPWKFEIRGEGVPNCCLVFHTRDAALHAELFPLGTSRTKKMPHYVKQWSPALLAIVLEWGLMGDGRNRTGRDGDLIEEYATSSPQLAADYYDLMLKLGTGGNILTYEPHDKPSPDPGRIILAENQAPMNIVYKNRSKSISMDYRFLEASEHDYNGKVYCVNVNNGTWLMKYNDKICWTGNCDHPATSVVSLQNVSHIMREARMDRDGTVYGAVELLNTPSGKILQSLVESGVKLGISSRGVGSVVQKKDYYEVQDDFVLISFDCVADPSTPSAFLLPEGRQIQEHDLRKMLNKSDRIDRVLNDILSK